MKTHLPNAIRYHLGRLVVDGCSVPRLLRGRSTPLVVYSQAALVDAGRRCRVAFNADFRLHVSYKACYYGPVLTTLHAEKLNAEVATVSEYLLARALKVPEHRIGWNPVALTNEEAELIARKKLAYVTLNTQDDFERVAAAARRMGSKVDVSLRVFPEGVNGRYIARGSRLGIDVADGSALSIARRITSARELRLRGVHCHICTDETRSTQHVIVLDSLIKFAQTVFSTTGHRFDSLGIGGGIASPRSLALAGQSIETFARGLNEGLQRLPWPMTVVLEPGRYFVNDSAICLTKILSQTSCAGRQWWIVDLSTNFLVPFGGRQFDVIPVTSTSRKRIRVSIGDRLSSFSGVICEDVRMPPAKSGDTLAVVSAGAYTGSAAQRLMCGQPEVVLVGNGDINSVSLRERDADWVKDVIGRTRV